MKYEEAAKIIETLKKEKIHSCRGEEDGKMISALQLAVDALKHLAR